MTDYITEKTGDYMEKDRACIAHTYGRYEKLIVSGKGAVCTDEEGNRIIDFTSGIGVNSLGFADEKWAEAVSRQASSMQHISNLFYSGPQIRLAEMLTRRTGMEKVFFANSGAEANECALKTARKYGNLQSGGRKNRIITLENSFHGRTMGALTATGQEKLQQNFGPVLPGFDYCPAEDLQKLAELAGEDTCAVMVELIQGEGGVVPLSREFVQDCQALCREKGMLLIVDEVQTGIGRTGTLFAYEQYGLEPDLVTFAKGIGGGLPLGGVLFGKKTADVLQPGDHGTTFGGNPVACAGGCAVLERLDEAFLQEVREKGQYLSEKLAEIPGIYDITGKGLMVGCRAKGAASGDVVKSAMAEGLLLLTAKDKIRMLPPLVITYEQIDEGIEKLKKAIGQQKSSR